MNSKAVADALAARFVGVTATNGGVTEAFAITPTASLPNQIGKGPALLVFHPKGVLGLTLRLRDDVLDYPVRFLRDPVDYASRSDWLYAWQDALRDRIEMQVSLGLSYVAAAHPVSLDVQLDGATYAGTSYDLIEMTARVWFNEVVTTIAP